MWYDNTKKLSIKIISDDVQSMSSSKLAVQQLLKSYNLPRLASASVAQIAVAYETSGNYDTSIFGTIILNLLNNVNNNS